MPSIYDYNLITEFTTKGAGLSRWAFAEKNGRKYFIKEFLKPVYPTSADNLTPELEERRRKKCLKFYNERILFYEELKKCRTGNNVVVEEFFRFGGRYYVVSDKVKKSDISIQEVAALPDDKKRVLCSSILYSIKELHSHGIVHADIKPDNILLKRTANGYITAKIIDFDSSFFATEIPEEVNGDFVYLAPETFLRMSQEAGEIRGKADVFSLGLLFHQYYTGELPEFEDGCTYAFEAVLSGAELSVSDRLPPYMKQLITDMLRADPEERLSSSEAFARLRAAEPFEDTAVSCIPPAADVVNPQPKNIMYEIL